MTSPPPQQQASGEGGEEPDEPTGTAHQSMELPTVVLGGGEGAEEQAPARRLLQGRVDPKAIFYPIYLLIIFSCQQVVEVTVLERREWAMLPVLLGWGQIFLWVWIYRVAWTYRRWLLRWVSLPAAMGLALGLAQLCYDRADAQAVAIAQGLVQREALGALDWAGHMLVAVAAILLAHAAFLGRGYREKVAG